jgi:hypothetical protein
LKRKRPSKRDLVLMWEASRGICWRCELPIGKDAVYGTDWEAGHVDKPHWMGGMVLAPEHVICNREDARDQTRAAAKSVRIRARNIGVKKPSPFWKPYKPEYTPGRWHDWFDENGRERSTWIPPTLVGDKGH